MTFVNDYVAPLQIFQYFSIYIVRKKKKIQILLLGEASTDMIAHTSDDDLKRSNDHWKISDSIDSCYFKFLLNII